MSTRRHSAGSTVNHDASPPAPLARDDREDRNTRRVAVARDIAKTVDADLAALIVEAVAVQQALVRDAHPDDVLQRMRAVEEIARTASAHLRRLMTVASLLDASSDPNGVTGSGADDVRSGSEST